MGEPLIGETFLKFVPFQLNKREFRFYTETHIEFESHNKKDNWKPIKMSNSLGYKVINVYGDVHKIFKVHRVVYFVYNQDWDIYDDSPDNQINHENGIKTDNIYENLRVAKASQNSCSRKNTKCYYYSKVRNKYIIQMIECGRTTTHGGFRNESTAIIHVARLKAERNKRIW